MPKISTYQQQVPASGDFVLGIDVSDTSSDPGGETVKFSTDDLARPLTIETAVQTGATYTPALSDHGKIIPMSSTGGQTFVLPANSTVTLPIGFTVTIVQEGAGVVTIDAATGVTVRGVSGGAGQISAQYGAVTAYKRAINDWVIIGAIGAVV